MIGGLNVTVGYLKQAEETAKVYKEEGGKRWFYTGDIGVVEADGCLRIVGEFVGWSLTNFCHSNRAT